MAATDATKFLNKTEYAESLSRMRSYIDGVVPTKLSDLTDDVVAGNYLPLSGGTMTGAITFANANNTVVGLQATNAGGTGLNNLDIGWSWSGGAGAGVALRSNTATATGSGPGSFDIYARSGTAAANTRHLIGKPDGTLSWGGSFTATSIIKDGGTSSQFLKADGSVDSTAYLPLSGGTMTGRIIWSGSSVIGNVEGGWNISGNQTGIQLLDDTVTADTGSPGRYSSGFHIGGYYAFQLAYDRTNMLWRGGPGSGSAWKTVYDSTNLTKSVVTTLLGDTYLPLSGGTMAGPLAWSGSTALPATTEASYFLAVDTFASGGQTKYITAANLAKSIASDVATEIGLSNYLPHYQYAVTNSSAYLWIKINNTEAWAGSFTVKLYTSYHFEIYEIGGYNYKNQTGWYSAKARLLVSTARNSVDVILGYTSAQELWFAIPVTSTASGQPKRVMICDYNGSWLQEHTDFSCVTVASAEELEGTIQSTVTLTTYLSTTTGVTIDTDQTISGTKTFSSGLLTISTATTGTPTLEFRRGATSDGYVDYKIVSSGGALQFVYSASGTDTVKAQFVTSAFRPAGTVTNKVSDITLGNSDYYWGGVYSSVGNFLSNVNVGGTFRVLTSGGSYAKLLVYPTNPYGIVFKSASNGTMTIQSQRESDDSETYSLVLNPSGGNVGVGTSSPSYKLDVNGTTGVSGLSTLAGGIVLGTSTNAVAAKMEWDETNNAWKLNGNFYATGFVSAGGLNSSGGSGGGSTVTVIRAWSEYVATDTSQALGANLGYSLKSSIEDLDQDIYELDNRVTALEQGGGGGGTTTDPTLRMYPTTTNAWYSVLARYNNTSGSTYYTEYGRYTDNVQINPATGALLATSLSAYNSIDTQGTLSVGLDATIGGSLTVTGDSTFSGVTAFEDSITIDGVITLVDGQSSAEYQYPRYKLCASEAAYNAIVTKRTDVLYLIPES